ncbi:MAG TPA: hypothetical protein VFF73_07380, partial [Planctomycetota bacterium]|nr:hypothetical protein [Planctomycetota bacterium]
LPDGRLMPGCAYNMFYRHKDPRFVGAVGKADIWGKPAKKSHEPTDEPPASGKPLPIVGP